MKSFIKKSFLLAIVFGLFFGMGCGLVELFAPSVPTVATSDPIEPPPTIVDDKKRTNILLLGVDARKGEEISRSDTIILASIDPKLNRAALVSIPRDTKISGSAAGGMDKINAANVAGGPEYAVEKVEELMNEQIDYYVEVDFEGFKNIIDALGGVTIDVDQRMYKPSEDINLKSGLQTLDGYGALAFVRYRDYPMGDIERTEHQQAFLKALGQEVLKPATIVKLPTLVREVKANVKTNLGLKDMLKMAAWAPGFTSESIVAQTLPGSFYDQRNAQGVLTASYWVADKNKTTTLLNTMLNGQTVAVVQGSSTTVTKAPTTPAVNKPSNTTPATQNTNTKSTTEDKADTKTDDSKKTTESESNDDDSKTTTKPQSPTSDAKTSKTTQPPADAKSIKTSTQSNPGKGANI